jgi:cytochrome c553
MWNTQPVSDAMLETIAKYYVRQAPAQARSTGPLVTEGRELYANGDIAERLPACEQCHGMYAEGKGATPRLAGQHGAYLENQLNGFRLGLREGNVMHPATMNMTDDQIAAIVAYLAND